MSTRLVYIPGLGDSYDGFRSFALRGWQDNDLVSQLYPMKWRTDEPLDVKLAALRALINSSTENIVLVGESAGGSVVVSLLREFPDQIDHVITICGKNHTASNVSEDRYRKKPAFRVSMHRADQAVRELTPEMRDKMTIIYSDHDATVRPTDTIIDGAHTIKLATPGHLTTIGLLLTVLRNRVIRIAVDTPE